MACTLRRSKQQADPVSGRTICMKKKSRVESFCSEECPLGRCFSESTVCGFYQTKKCLNRRVILPDGGSSLRQYVAFYRKLGFSVIPLRFKEKTPALSTWKEYQSRKPTDQEIAEWFLGERPVNIGILCGAVSDNLGVIDFDSEDAYRRFFGPEIEKKTLVVKTAKAYHVYVRSRRTPNCFKIAELKIDVKGEGGYVVAPPSIHPSGHEYSFVNPEVKEVMEVLDLEEAVWNGAEKLGVKRESFLADKDDLPCVKAILKGVEPGFRNEAGIRLAAYWLYHKHESREVTWDLLKAWNRRNKPPLPDTEIKNIVKSALRGGYEYGCKGFKDIKACDPETEKNCPIKDALRIRKVEVVKTPFVELSDGRLAEQGYDGKKVYYLVYDPKTGKVTKEDFIVNGGDGEIRFEPIMNKDVETGQVLLPSEAAEYGSNDQLWNEALAFLDYWHEQRNRKERTLDLAYDFATHVKDLLAIMGYRRKLAPYGKGKTTDIEVNGSISYRPFFLAGCDSEASIRRTFDLWRGTAIMDEADFSRSDLYAVIIKILNIGDDARLGWYRCCDENDPTKILSFYVYGPKHLATRKRFKDIATESRCLTSTTEENRSPKPLFRSKTFLQQALQLRNQLLMWRFKNYHGLKEKVKQLEDPEITKKLFGEDLAVSGRIKQIIIPVAIALENPKIVEILKETAKEHHEILKSLDKEQAIKDQVDEALKQILTELQDSKELQDYSSAKVDLATGILKVRLPDISRKILGKDVTADDLKGFSQQVRDYFVDRRHLVVKAEAQNVRWVYLSSEILTEMGFESLAPSIKPVTPSAPVTQETEKPKQAILEAPKPPSVERLEPEDWKAAHSDFFVGSKQPLKAAKPSGTLDVCYTCWMAPKYHYQEMLKAGTVRTEPIKPTGKHICQLCGKEPAGYRVIA